MTITRELQLAARPVGKPQPTDVRIAQVPLPEGFLVLDYIARYPDALAEMSGWLADGRLTSVEDTVPGRLEDFPSTLLRLFNGENTGKLVRELQR